METYKINSTRLKSLVGHKLKLIDEFYKFNEKNLTKDDPDSVKSDIVTIDSVELSDETGFMKVVCTDKGGHRKVLSLRRNGLSINRNEKGLYKHYFNYPELNYILVKVATSDIHIGVCTKQFFIPLSMKSDLIRGYANIYDNIVAIKVSNEVFNTITEVNESDITYTKIY